MKRRTKILLITLLSVALTMLLAGCASSGGVQEGASIDNGSVISSEEMQDQESQGQGDETPADGSQSDDAGATAAEGSETDDGSGDGTDLSRFTVAIDAGHQDHANTDPEPIGPGASETKYKVTGGTSGRYTGVPEYQVNLDVALLLRDWLEAKGVNVVMVRETNEVDISNSERAAMANQAGAALFVRIHCDGSEDASRNGFSTLVPANNSWTAPIYEESARAGALVQTAAIAATGAQDLGVIERSDLSGFNWCEVPSVLVEMGFMSNQEDDNKLVDPAYQQLLAQGIGQGVIAYLQTL